jgi:hypothetical protein
VARHALVPVLLRGPAAIGHPWPGAATAASLPRCPLRRTSTRPLDEARNNPNRVEKFKEATLKGWKYALENKEEIIQLIHEKYTKEKSIEHLRYEANAIDSLINKDVTPLGYLDQGRIRYISEMYKYYGLTESKIDLNNFLFEEISKEDNQDKNIRDSLYQLQISCLNEKINERPLFKQILKELIIF